MLDLKHVPIAIVGMACRLPGADGLEQYWQLLREGRSAIGELPAERLDRELYYAPEKGVVGKSYSTLGALISNRPLDREICPLPHDLIEGADVAHLTLCEVAASACRLAGYDPFDLPSRNVGVYIGHTGGSEIISDIVFAKCADEALDCLRKVPEFAKLGPTGDDVIRQVVAQIRARYGHDAAGTKYDLAARAASTLIAKAFGLTGPDMVIDAACASSLQAMAIGARALQQGQIDMAVVGGASYCKSDSLVLFSQAQSVSASGSCPFGADADGLISAEGHVVLVLKTLERAEADGDRIQAVIRGIGVSSDGRGRSLWAPRKEGQILAVHRAYGSDIDVTRLQYIEAHATSTQVGDATELEALTEALVDRLPPGTKLPVGSVKANVGHTLETAGMAGLLKVVLAMQHQTIPPAINCQELNKKIDWDASPFQVPMQERPWPAPADGHPRRAAVNAFGIGGLNVHVVLDEYQPSAKSTTRGALPASGLRQPTVATPASEIVSEPVAVIGMGAILPGAYSVEAFWELLRDGRDPKSEVPPERWNIDRAFTLAEPDEYQTTGRLGGFVRDFEYDWKRHKIPPKQVAHANPLQFMLLEAADLALRDAGYHEKKLDRAAVAVVVGTMFGGDFSHQLQMGIRLPEMQRMLRTTLRERGVPEATIEAVIEPFGDALLKRMPALLDETGSFTSSTLASRITKTFDLMGGALALDAGACSGLAAIDVGLNLLRTGTCDVVVCAAGQRAMDLVSYSSLSRDGVLASSQPKAAFDAEADGLVPGEGAGVVLLKRLSDARRDGDKIRAVIRGAGAGRGATLDEALAVATRRALAASGLEPSRISAIETLGRGVAMEDTSEIQALTDVYGSGTRRQPVLLGSLKAQMGDLGAAAGMAGLIKCTLALEHRMLPASWGLQRPSPALAAQRDRLRAVPDMTTLTASHSSGYTAEMISAAQHNLSYQLVIDNGAELPASAKRVPTAPAAAAEECRVVRFGAADAAALALLLQEASAGELASRFARADEVQFTDRDRFRLAIVAAGPEVLATKLTLARAQFREVGARQMLEEQGIFCCEASAERPRVALLCPGQGSQYAGMLRELTRDVPAAARCLAEVDETMARLGYESFEHVVSGAPERLGSDVWYTQISMLLADVIAQAAVFDLGLRPDVVAGHSFGEFAGLVAAGAWDLETAIRATRCRADAIAAGGSTPGALLSVWSTREAVEDQLLGTTGLWVSAHNGPEQTVVGGQREAVARFADQLAARKIKTRLLQVPSAFHTPLMRGTQAPLAAGLNALGIGRPTLPILSSATVRYLHDAREIRASLVAQMTEPVRFLESIERLVAEGVQVFVEAGPQQVLTQLARRIAPDPRISLIACDHPRRPGREQLLRVQALLECRGLLPVDEAAARSVAPTPRPAEVASGRKHTPIHFDATAPRRERMRSKSASNGHAPVVPREPAAPPRPSSSNGSAGVHRPQPKAAPASAPVAKASNARHAEPVAKAAVADAKRAEPQTFEAADLLMSLVNEVVGSLTSKAKARNGAASKLTPLGVDREQLISELGEFFDLSPADKGTLARLASIEQVVDFLRVRPGKSQWLDEHGNATEGSGNHQPRASTTAVAAPPVRAKGSAQTKDLETFLVNFVVEQTGYPPEIVELDVDLEADLGIDSIKKAQLFGELGEQFELTQVEGMSLDDFPTLRHVLDFLAEQTGATSPESAAPAPAVPAPAPAKLSPSSNGSGGSNGHAPAPPRRQPPAAAVSTAPSRSREELSEFLVNFVVEQTGYPPEIVELDVDLEADLGIDSIKKAQLFGELGEQFELTQVEGMSLDDFPTLRHVLDFLAEQIGTTTAAAPTPPTPRSTPAAAAGHGSNGHSGAKARHGVATAPVATATPAAADPVQATPSRTREELSEFLVNFVVEQTGYPPEIVELDVDLEADLGIDSIKKAQLFGELGEQFELTQVEGMSLDDFPTLRHVLDFLAEQIGTSPTAPPPAPVAPQPVVSAPLHSNGQAKAPHKPEPVAAPVSAAPVSTAATRTAEELSEFLVNFVVEQTGYPPEIVELDVDLEADLGIDSIKKAQLFGELGEQFELTQVEGMSLDDFPTLRHVLDYLLRQPSVTGSAAPAGQVEEKPQLDEQSAVELLESVLDRSEGDEPRLPFHEKSPAGFARGVAYGQARQAALRRVLRRLADRLEDGPAPTERSVLSAQLDDELRGIAQGAKVAAANVVTLYRFAADGRFAVDGSMETILGPRTGSDSESPAVSTAGESTPVHFERRYQGEPVTRRFVLRMVDAPRQHVTPSPSFAGGVVIVGRGADARALGTKLTGAGAVVSFIDASAGPQAAVAEFERAWQDGPAPHLFVMTGRDDAPRTGNAADWERRRTAGLLVPFAVCQRFVALVNQAKLVEQASLLAATALGGNFGLTGAIRLPEGGGIAGLLKAIRNEVPGLRIKVVDALAGSNPAAVAELLVAEFATHDSEVEVGYVGELRQTVRVIEEPLGEDAWRQMPARGENWVVTGGARGVTAVVARELARQFGVRLHLIGSTPLDPHVAEWRTLSDEGLKQLRQKTMVAAHQTGRQGPAAWREVEKSLEIDRNLQALSSAGIDAEYHACNVADRQSLGEVLEQIRGSSGPIAGVIHGAGFEAASRFERKRLDSVAATIAAKVDGAAALIALTRQDPLRWFVGFGSTSGRFGGLGQTDYSMANEMLAKQIDELRRERPECKAVTFHWHAWDEVGMAARPESRFALKALKLNFMPPLEGVDHLIGELLAGAPEPEVVISERQFCAAAQPPLPTPAVAAPAVAAPGIAAPIASRRPTSAAAGRPLVDEVVLRDDRTWEGRATLDPCSDVFLLDHRLDGRPLLPGVVGLELMAESALVAFPDRKVGPFTNVSMASGFNFPDDTPREARVRMRPIAGGLQCSLLGEFSNRQGQVVERDRLMLEATLHWRKDADASVVPPPGPATLPMFPFGYRDSIALVHGRSLQALKSLFCNRSGGWACIAAPDMGELAGPRGGAGWVLPSAVLDACLVACGTYSFVMCEGRTEIPHGFDAVECVELPRAGEACVLRFFYRDQTETHTCYDFHLFGADDRLLLSVEGFRGVLLGARAK